MHAINLEIDVCPVFQNRYYLSSRNQMHDFTITAVTEADLNILG
jgi:hypothetical protein